MKSITVAEYDPSWPGIFERLHARVWPAVSEVALTIEHVGSTSVPGLAAKPVVDMTIIVQRNEDVPAAIERLAALGYAHRGNLGIEGREAFGSPDGLPAHNLYLCPRDSPALANHLAVRNYLRAHPDAATEYGELKKRLAKEFSHDIDSYIDGKTDFLLRILRAAGLREEKLREIERINRQISRRWGAGAPTPKDS